MSVIEYCTLPSGERAQFLDLMETAFQERELFERYFDHDPELSDHDTLVALEGGRLVSGLQIFTRTIRLKRRAIKLGGIGSVATRPNREGRGIATELLRRAVHEMIRRQMALCLLFAERTGFYQRLGWTQIEYPVWVVHRDSAPTAGGLGRPRNQHHLRDLMRLYDAYCADRELTTVRNSEYWKGQLRFAGNPDEDFRVVEREGTVVAYARQIELMTLSRVTEYARADEAAPELARLLLEMTPATKPLFVPCAGDEELASELGQRAGAVDTIRFPDAMWRVLDRPALEQLAGLSPQANDDELLASLVGEKSGVFWPSDRF